tara:strand:+ start:4087 stop:4218 length:132 start_codon:yes stop_codon:yes gene_type:complete
MKILRPIFGKIFFQVFNTDLKEDNLETEDGFNLLQENGDLIVL